MNYFNRMKKLCDTRLLGGDDGFPIVSDLWDFFSSKISKTVFVSIGSSSTPLPELDFTEMIGCPVHIFETSQEKLQAWDEIRELLKTRTETGAQTEFAKKAFKKWVLSKNILTYPLLPWFCKSTLECDEVPVKTLCFREALKSVFTHMKLSEEEERIDVLKIDSEGKECHILNAMLLEGFRPSILLVKWTESPGENFRSLQTAANLQMQGYVVVDKNENNYFYHFNDLNYYETCEWDQINSNGENPLILSATKTIVAQVKAKLQKEEKGDIPSNA